MIEIHVTKTILGARKIDESRRAALDPHYLLLPAIVEELEGPPTEGANREKRMKRHQVQAPLHQLADSDGSRGAGDVDCAFDDQQFLRRSRANGPIDPPGVFVQGAFGSLFRHVDDARG